MSLHSLHGFTTLFTDVDTEQLKTQIHFDTDSVFFVCDNFTTGHICNDIQWFVPGSLYQTNKVQQLQMDLAHVFKIEHLISVWFMTMTQDMLLSRQLPISSQLTSCFPQDVFLRSSLMSMGIQCQCKLWQGDQN
jgi:hypothetical protein